MPISSRFFVQLTSGLLFVAFAALLVIEGMTLWLGERSAAYFETFIATRDARSDAVELRSALQSAESAQRGYLYTGNEIYLSPYGSVKATAQRRLDSLNRRARELGSPTGALDRLSQLVAEKFQEMDRTISLKREYRNDDALGLVLTNRGKTLMDEANVFFAGIIRSYDEKLTVLVDDQKANAAILRIFSIVAGVVIIAVVGAATWTAMRYTGELGRARREVSILNAGLEEKVRARTADLAQANDEIQRFVHIISHDMRAPLVSIVGFAGEIRQELDDVRVLLEGCKAGDVPPEALIERIRAMTSHGASESLGYIRSSTDKLDRLISAVLKLAREGRRTPMREAIDLRELISASAAAIQHQLSEAGGAIAVDLRIGSIVSDRLALEQIVGNLLDNAVKYRSTSRPLQIGVRGMDSGGDTVEIEISDNGRGIAARDRDRIFDLFKRSGVQDTPGEGIGLAYVLTAVRHLGGQIRVTSELDEGTTFCLVLPRSLMPAELPEKAEGLL